MENNTAKHFVLQLGSLITLYLSLTFLILLLFSLVNLKFPDDISYYYTGEQSTLRLSIAMLIVFFPTYILLTRKTNELRRAEVNSTYSGLTKWLLYFSILIGGGVLLGDLVAVINAFLNGEISTRFLAKAGLLFVIIGASLYYYIEDVRGRWLKEEKNSIFYGGAVSLFVLISLVLGFLNAGTPAEVREKELDQRQITDLSEIQQRVAGLLELSSTTPKSLEVAYEGFPVPEAPENREAYSYEVTEKGFKLCATFAYDVDQNTSFPAYYDKSMTIPNGGNWNYKAGRYCFDRVVNPNPMKLQ